MTDDERAVLRFPQVQAEGLDDWRFFLMKLHARFRTGSFATGLELVTRIARAAGADPVHDAVERDWGGYTGYFGDPDGYRWEVAFNPGPIGQVVLP